MWILLTITVSCIRVFLLKAKYLWSFQELHGIFQWLINSIKNCFRLTSVWRSLSQGLSVIGYWRVYFNAVQNALERFFQFSLEIFENYYPKPKIKNLFSCENHILWQTISPIGCLCPLQRFVYILIFANEKWLTFWNLYNHISLSSKWFSIQHLFSICIWP